MLDFDQMIEDLTACIKRGIQICPQRTSAVVAFEVFGLGRRSYFSFVKTEMKLTEYLTSKLSLYTVLHHMNLSSVL